MPNFSVPRGTSDILPDTTPLWTQLETTARRICQSYGYREIRTPIFEDINLFKRSLGATSDVVNKQLLEVNSSRVELESTLENIQRTKESIGPFDPIGYALRPEGTASLVRSYIENSLDKNEFLSKLFYIGPMFRGERPQKGRLRQFHQVGVEAIGPNSISPYLDAEMIVLAMHLLKELGVKEPQLRINSLGSEEDKAHISVWLRKELAKHKNDLCADCQNRLERNVFRVLDCKKEGCRHLVSLVVKNLPLSIESQNYFNQVQSALTSIGIAFELSPHLVRGLDYYTHTVFEITAQGLGSQDAVGAGGRYGGLVGELGGSENVEGIGFALGIERILLASGKITAAVSGIDVFVIAMKEEYQKQAFVLLQQLRHAGLVADMGFAGGSMKSQMGKADKAQARFALILGDEEIKNQTAALKDMRKGQQETIAQKDMVKILCERIHVEN